MKKKLLNSTLLLLIVCIYSFDVLGQGYLDHSFGNKGIVTAMGKDLSAQANALALQSDGKIVIAGYGGDVTKYGFTLARFHTNGNLDSSFGTNGIQVTNMGADGGVAEDLVVQTDGKILVAGIYSGGGKRKFGVLRYKPNGTLDSTFDGDGIVTTAINLNADAQSLVVQSDGKIIVAGSSYDGQNKITVVRYRINGSLDSSFDGDGIVTTLVGSKGAYGNDVAIQNDGKIVVAGTSYNGDLEITLVRYNSNGSLDNSFDGDGKVTTDIGASEEYASSLAIQADGKIIIAGTTLGTHYKRALVRYNKDGSLDNSFDGDGIVTSTISTWSEEATDVALQVDSKIVIVGLSYNYPSVKQVFVALRYLPDGSPDSSFGGDGIITTEIDSFNSYANAVAIQPDGKIVAAGETRLSSSINSIALVRYNQTSLAIQEISRAKSMISVYPNPFFTQTILHSPTLLRNATLKVQNYLGQTLRIKEHISGKMVVLERSDLAPGIYSLQLIEDNQLIGTGKIMVADF